MKITTITSVGLISKPAISYKGVQRPIKNIAPKVPETITRTHDIKGFKGLLAGFLGLFGIRTVNKKEESQDLKTKLEELKAKRLTLEEERRKEFRANMRVLDLEIMINQKNATMRYCQDYEKRYVYAIELEKLKKEYAECTDNNEQRRKRIDNLDCKLDKINKLIAPIELDLMAAELSQMSSFNDCLKHIEGSDYPYRTDFSADDRGCYCTITYGDFSDGGELRVEKKQVLPDETYIAPEISTDKVAYCKSRFGEKNIVALCYDSDMDSVTVVLRTGHKKIFSSAKINDLIEDKD